MMNVDAERTFDSDGRSTIRLVKISAAWALAKLPIEYIGAQDAMEKGALVISAFLWIGIALMLIRGNPVARVVFIFLCALGVLAVTPALPAEYATLRFAFYISLVDCLIKGALFALLESSAHPP